MTIDDFLLEKNISCETLISYIEYIIKLTDNNLNTATLNQIYLNKRAKASLLSLRANEYTKFIIFYIWIENNLHLVDIDYLTLDAFVRNQKIDSIIK